VFGTTGGAPAVPSDVPADPLAALESALLPALLRGPCVVSFSGGRDSSAVLAAAAALARREGLPLPVAATNVFPTARWAGESEWQERVIAQLELDDWVRLELTDELDCVGPIARSIVERHGLLWPFNVHFHWPLLEVARGGSLLTGIGGDELLGTSQWARAAAVLSRSARPVPRDLLRVGLAASPPRVRRRVLCRRGGVAFDWLTPEANEQILAAWSDDMAHEPLRWSRRWAWWRSLRSVDVGFRSLDLIASDNDVQVVHPLADGRFAVSAGQHAAAGGIHDRTALMQTLFADLLPPDVQERSTKASFDEVFWGPHSRSLASESLAELAELAAVDPQGLQAEWAEETPDAHSFLLLQALAARSAAQHSPSALDSNGLAIGVVVASAPAA
jgi:hypothetical protein